MCKIIICGCSHVENVNMKNASTIFFCRKSSGDAAAMTAGDFFKTEIYVSHEILPETREFMFLPAMKEEGGEPAEEPHKEQVEVLAFTDADSNEDFPPDNVNVKQEDSSDEFTPEHSKKTKQSLKRKKVRGRPPKTIKGKKRAKKNDPLDEEEQNTEPESDTNEDNVDDPESSVNPEEDRSIDQSIEIPSTSLGEGPYTCQICKKTYATKANFHSHVLSHQGISNFFCEICGKSIDTRGAWKHMQSHEDINLNCPVCNKPFATPARLDRHVKTTHSDSDSSTINLRGIKGHSTKILQYTKENMIKATAAVKAGMGLRAAAARYKVPRTTLHKKVTGISPENAILGGPSTLKREEELALAQWIISCEELGHKITRSELLDAVQKLCKQLKIETKSSNNRLGVCWLRGFLKRNPILFKRLTKEREELSIIKILEMRQLIPTTAENSEKASDNGLDVFIRHFGTFEDSLVFKTLKTIFWPVRSS